MLRVVDERGKELAQYIEPPMCAVPDGPFLMGSAEKGRDAYVEETPQHSVILPAFQIGRYPVTMGEYDCAVRAGAVEVPQEYEDEPTWEDDVSYPDVPVCGVDWFRAMQYARWLREVTGRAWDVPSEAQWEKAARGTHGRVFPWGNERNPTLGTTNDGVSTIVTPIGQYPDESASPYGAFDLVGNVFEWTKSIAQRYPYTPQDGREETRDTREPRVLRGGHYGGYSGYAHAAYRFSARPAESFVSYGFRLALNQTDAGE